VLPDLNFAGMSALVFRYTHRVTYAECTLGNHIYHARYLDILEAARGELFRCTGTSFFDLQLKDVILPVIECRLRYKAPARYDDVLTVEAWATAAEGVRVNFSYRILNPSGRLILQAETLHVCTGTNDKPKRVPKELIGVLEPYLHL
jgi:acyl-CoA thioester hydrolase